MKETVNVSIAGIAFILDKQCYALLSNYLTQTELSLKSNSDARELLADIEARIAEQILNVQTAEKPVSIEILRPIITQLGGVVTPASEVQHDANMFAKRLYRNPNGAMFGGVCNGLASYFGISPVIFRALFLVPLFFGGFTMIWDVDVFRWVFSSLNSTAILIYVILWIVVPKAKTPRQHLEMQGDDITVGSISQQSVNRTNDVASTAVVGILKVIAITFACILFFGTLLSVVVSSIAISVNTVHYPEGLPMLLDVLNLSFGWAALWAAAIMLLPVWGICYLIFSAVFSWKYCKAVLGILFGVWFLVLMGAFVLVMIYTSELASISYYYWD